MNIIKYYLTALVDLYLLACCGALLAQNSVVLPGSTNDFIYQLKQSLVKVTSTTKSGGLSHGTGVAISKNHVVTNCHVIAGSNGVSITVWGEAFGPVSMQADWKHDLCILKFEWAKLTPVELGDSEKLRYEQPVISISMPGDSPAPQVVRSNIKALYAYDNAQVIRSAAAFSIGASGSPLFDFEGKLIGISTFKSPGQGAYFYNMPVAWVKAALQSPELPAFKVEDTPFWDAPETERPYFMRVVLPYQNRRWADVQDVASAWSASEPQSAEAHYYWGYALLNLDKKEEAKAQFNRALALHPNHPATVMALGLMAKQVGDSEGVEQAHTTLKAIDDSLDAEFTAALETQK